MAAIPDTGGAGYAPRGVMRALLRLVVLGVLVTVGWLLGAGTSHADDDLGQPGAGLIPVINTAVASDDRSGDLLGAPPSVRPAVKDPLSNASVPRRPAQSPVQVRILRPVVDAVNVARPLARALTPASRPLSGTVLLHPALLHPALLHPALLQPPAAPHPVAQSPVPVDQPATAPFVTTTAPIPATSVRTVVRDAVPAVTLRAPAAPTTHPMAVPVAIGNGPVAPMPASPPGGTTAPCMIGGSGGSTSAKGALDVAVRDGWAIGSLSPPHGLGARNTSDLPGSLSVQPSTSPD